MTTAHATARAATRRPLVLTPSAAPEADLAPPASAAGPGAEAAPHAERALARAVGVAVHRVLDHWDGSNAGSDARLRVAAARAAAGTDVPAATIEAEARLVLRAFADSPLATRLAVVTILGREVPLLLDADEGAVWSGSIDLPLPRPRQADLVADFKTDRDTRDIAATYRDQLAIYAEAVRRALGPSESLVAELWLLREGRRVTVDARHTPGESAA